MNNKVPPGPPIKFFGLNQLPRFRRERMMKTFEECAATYGDVVRVRFGGFQQTMLFHPDHVRQLLIEMPETIRRSRLQKRTLGLFHGNSLINSEGDFWRRQRKLAQPAFHTRRIQQYVDTMVDETASTIEKWETGTIYDIAEEMVNLTLSVASNTLFGTDVKAVAARIEKTLEILQQYAMRKAPAMLPLPIWVPTPLHRNTKWALEELRSLVTDFIESRRATGEDRGDLLSMLLLAIDEDLEFGGGQMTSMQARDEALSMLIVGHQTTASALSWTFYEIMQHPEVEAKLVEELDTVLAGRALTMQDIRQLKYLDMVIKESLRLHPPSWAMPRDIVQDVEVGGYHIPKGTGVLFCQHVIQRDSRWFPEPDRFLPERFADGWENKVPKCAFMPFGVGPHNCIGQIFAITEMHVILAMVFQRFRLALVPGQEIVPSALVSQRPRDGLRMQVELREPVMMRAYPTL